MKPVLAALALGAALARPAHGQQPAQPPASQPAAPRQPPEAALSVPTAPQLAALCDGCAWVQQVRMESREPKASGLGAVGGAVLGGLLGSQVGGGSGRKLATVGGAVAGGVAGNAVEKNNAGPGVAWDVLVVEKDGRIRHVQQAADPALRPGDVVRDVDGRLLRQQAAAAPAP